MSTRDKILTILIVVAVAAVLLAFINAVLVPDVAEAAPRYTINCPKCRWWDIACKFVNKTTGCKVW